MNHTSFDDLLELAAASSTGDKCRRLGENMLRSTQASAIGLMAVSAEDGSHREMLNLEYPPETARHHTTARYTRHCDALKLVFRRPETLHRWEDIPRFRESYEAQSVYGPAGFRNGTSIVLRSPGGRGVALLHVSVRAPLFDAETMAALIAARPVLTDWAVTLARFDAARLSAREGQVLALIRDGLSNAQIAEELVLAPRTVTTHVESILRKLAASNRTEAAVLAERCGLLRPNAADRPGTPAASRAGA
ncbi:response regulator transcription factor [Nocardioides sp. BYT-33-1]|uniref:response regulator transcription factor n=1 Tax=Nocardioides sp. BYT-33-1 TaxID=3416952 RepID=UPI003F53E1B3